MFNTIKQHWTKYQYSTLVTADIPHFCHVSVPIKFIVKSNVIYLIFIVPYIMIMVHYYYLSIFEYKFQYFTSSKWNNACGAQWPMVCMQNAYFPDIGVGSANNGNWELKYRYWQYQLLAISVPTLVNIIPAYLM